MPPLTDDVFAQLEQLQTRSAVADSAVNNDPTLSSRLGDYHQRYWWMKPDAMWSLAKSGIDPTSPTAYAAALSAGHLAAQGTGFQPLGSPVTKPGQPPDVTSILQSLDQQPRVTPHPDPSRYAAAPRDLGLGGRQISAPASPAQQLAGDEWFKLDPGVQDELRRVSFAPAPADAASAITNYLTPDAALNPTAGPRNPSTFYSLVGADNLSDAARQALRDKVLTSKSTGGQVNFYGTPGAIQIPNMTGPVVEIGKATDPAYYASVNEALNGAPSSFQVGSLAASTVLSAPLQEVQGQIRNLHELLYEHDNPNWLQSQSDLGIVAGDLLHGRKVDLGSGYFPGGGVVAERQRRETERGRINGQAITAGRWFADALPDSYAGYHVMEPGSNEYRALSGTVDAATALAADPTVWLLGGYSKSAKAAELFSGEGSVVKAIKTFRETGEVLPALRTFHDAGGISGLRGLVSKDASDAWLTSPAQQPFRQMLVDNHDAYSIFRGFQRQLPPKVAADLADATSEQDVVSILRDQLGGAVRTKPKLAQFTGGSSPLDLGVSGPGEALNVAKAKVPSRWVMAMPDSMVDSADLGANAVQLERAAPIMKLGDQQFAALFDEMARAQTPIEVRNVWSKAADQVAESLVEKGFPLEEAKRLTRLNQVDEATDRVYATRQIADGHGSIDKQPIVDGKPMFVPDTKPTFLAQTLNSNISLPDWRALRKALSRADTLFTSDFATSAERAMLWSQNKVWKMAAISSPKTAVKVVADEQFAMSGRGFASLLSGHPISALSYVLATPLGEVPEDVGFLNRLAAATEGKVRWSKLPGAVVGGGIQSAKRGATVALRDIAEHIPGVEPRLLAGYSAEGAQPFDTMHAMQSVLGGGVDTAGENLGILHAPDWKILERKPGVNDTEFLHAHGRHFAQMAASEDMKMFANAETLQAAQDSYFNGALSGARERFMQSRPDLALDTRAGSDAQVVRSMEQMQAITNGNPELMDTIASGKLGDTPIWAYGTDGTPKVSGNFLKKLSNYGEDFPLATPQQKAIYSVDAARRQIADNIFGRFVHSLISVPSAVLSKSPLFRQAYWQRTIEMAPFMTADAQAAVLDVARGEANLGRGLIKDLESAVGRSTGALDADTADQYAKAHGLDLVRTTTHEFSQRNQGMDMLRVLTPFGEVWRKTVKRWGSIIAENPRVVRRAQQGFQALQSPELGAFMGGPAGEGFFHTDPLSGQEVFTIPGSEFATQALSGVPVPLVGSVKGLSLGTEFFPALGPVASIPVAWTLEKLHLMKTDTPLGPLGEVLFPYGPPKNPSDLWNYAPSWLQKAAGQDRETSPDSVRTFNNAVKSILSYGMTSGEYDTATTAGMSAAIEDAEKKAHALYVVRGFAQFFIPGAPAPEWLLKKENGPLVDAGILIGEYHDMQNGKYPGIDATNASQAFLAKYGPAIFKAATPKSYSYVFGLPTDPNAAQWVDEHSNVRRDFPLTYGYFAPPSDPNNFDYQTYLDQLLPGQGRQALDAKQWLMVSNSRLAAAQYGYLRDTVDAATGGKLNDATRAALAIYKQQLMDQYPGYAQSLNNWGGTGVQGRAGPQQLVDETVKAASDPTVQSTDAGQGLLAYLNVQDTIDAAWEQSGKKKGSWATTDGSAGIALRAIMRQTATGIESTHPQFGPLFENVFQRWMRDDSNPANLTPGGG